MAVTDEDISQAFWYVLEEELRADEEKAEQSIIKEDALEVRMTQMTQTLDRNSGIGRSGNTGRIRIITVIAAAAAVMIAVTLSAAAFCELFTHMLRESFPAHNQYSIQNNGDIENGVYTLTYLPNGFFLSEQSEDIDFVLKSWKNAAGNCILFQQFRAESLTLSIDNEKNTSEQIIVKGIPVDLYTGDQLSTAVWALDGCCFCISYYGEISAEEMIALIEGSQICAE